MKDKKQIILPKRENWIIAEREKQKVFLSVLNTRGASVRSACEASGIDREKYNKWLTNESFARTVSLAFENSKDMLEETMHKRIEEGSNDLLKYALTALAPERGYAQKVINQNEVSVTIQSVVSSIWDNSQKSIDGEVVES
jgi:hypothetical protein